MVQAYTCTKDREGNKVTKEEMEVTMKPALVKRRRKLLIGLLLLGLLTLLTPATASADNHSVPETNAESVSLIDVDSGRILYTQQGDKEMRIASLTKVMTAIIAIEHGNLEDRVKVSARAYGKEGSSIYLRLGEEMSLHHMLYGLMLRSGNDAATAIAEHIGGSLEGFVFMMNQKAQELGMNHTSFKNPHGLDEKEHYSSANDMALLAAYALKNPIFKDIVKTKKISVPNPYEQWNHVWYNKNRMLSMYEGADGVKTGYTKLAHRTLITSATRDGRQLAVVTLNDGTDWADHAKLFDFGFEYFLPHTLVKREAPLKGIPYVPASSFTYPLQKDEHRHIKANITKTNADTVDYKLGERGWLTFTLNGTSIGSVMLVEPDSARLHRDEHSSSTFSFTKKGNVSATAGYWYTLKTVVEALFTF